MKPFFSWIQMVRFRIVRLYRGASFRYYSGTRVGRVLFFLTLVFFGTGCEVWSRYQIEQGNEKFQKQYLAEAEAVYKKAEEHTEIGYIATNNRGILEYLRQDFEKAEKVLQDSADKSCEQTPKDRHCDEIYYNLGNAYYRLGEASQDPSIQIDQWKQAVTSYQRSLQINSEDTEAKENLAFVQEKLQQAESESSQQGQQAEASDQAGAEGNHKEGGEEGEKGGEENAEGESKEGASGTEEANEKAKKSAAEKAAEEAKYGLSKGLEKQLEQYLEQMKQKEGRAQQHFQRNPESQKNDPNDLFNDPFFQQFMGGNPFQQDFKGNGEGKELEKDW